ncbi:hypothetical protein I553_5153 [Mycobacterium xenopi 4042]|uniref:Enoyl-CoA hydratase/isomerase family protein n=1 Tax=Mycobacterium xenopi 4042 TaxID=1299334 RepID=X7ZXJ3_MYCXE|nr:hypothetical protein I553_5153 [Mycobacterium xenopi 4042]
MADGSAQVVQAVKSLLTSTIHLNLDDAIAREHAVVADLFDSPDAREGFAAFLQKRRPNFTRK